MKAQVIYNPVAGQRDVHGQVGQVLEYLRSRGWDVRALETHSPGEATQFARQAATSGCRVVLAAGGDGTLNEVVNGIMGSEVAVGILPIGTGNVWAKEIGVPVSTTLHPHRLLDAAKVLEDGVVRTVDAGRVNDRYFLLWAGIGFDAQVVAEIEPQFEAKRRWGILAFIVTGVVIASTFAGNRASLAIDGYAFRQRVTIILVSNTQHYGGGLVHVAPQACLDDGYLDIYVFEGEGPWAPVRHALGLLTRQHLHDPRVTCYRARHLRIEASKPMPVHVDGSPAGETPVQVVLVPRSLNVLVPRKVRKSLFADPAATGVPLRDLVG